ncbi:uncharacterized protein LOC142635294 [Castanea sativa]|uniref:uncharacterized protein LOC142635294 n=1 Tax=Castanea sativa TaxID=21020 RepID=UPI003F649CB3
MTKMFRDKIGSIVEVYIDDMVEKSQENQRHINDLTECGGWKVSRAYDYSSGDGSEPRLDKCHQVAQTTKQPKGCARVNLDDNSIEPFCFKVGEDLYMYLAVSVHAMSAVLLKDQEGRQRPIYYVNKRLVDAKTRYLLLEKLALVLVHATRKLSHYFQAHMVYVLTEYPLQSLLKRSDFTGRIAKWRTKLRSFDIRYKPRSSIKGQVLVDFVAKFTPYEGSLYEVYNMVVRPWNVFVDSTSNARGAGIGIILVSLEGVKLEHFLRLGFRASNNEAEYKALIVGFKATHNLEVADVEVYSGSRLVVS